MTGAQPPYNQPNYPPGYPAPPYPQQPYPQQPPYYPPQYPPQGQPVAQPYPPQQPYAPQQPYPQQPQPPYPQQGQFPQQPYPAQPQQPYGNGGQPIVIPVEGKGMAKLGAKMGPKRNLIISAESFGYSDRGGTFTISWPELRRITITTAYHQSGVIGPKTWRVRVVLDTADPNFPQRHPELNGAMGKHGGTGPGSYGIPLGPVPNLVAPLAQALEMYGRQVFGGVIEEGRVMGLGYA